MFNANTSEGFQHQANNLKVTINTSVTIKLRTHLQWAARGQWISCTGMQYRIGVTQAVNSITINAVGINTSYLRSNVCTNPHGATRFLINHLKRS